MGVPILATALIKVLARRGARVAALLRARGWEPLEVYPFATLRLLGLPTEGKRTQLGRRRIHHALQPLVPGLDHPDASEHQIDAVVCALTAHLWQLGLARAVGAEDEGQTIIPGEAAAGWLADQERAPLRRVAEAREAYRVDDPVP
jgi:predicted nuclease with RNAse H fold